MVMNLKQLFNIVGERRSLDFKIPIEELSSLMGYQFISPVHVVGEIYNRAGIVTIVFSTEFTLRLICDRCLKEFDRTYSYKFEHIIVKSLNTDNDDYIVAESEHCDLNEVALSDLLLKLPSKILCDDECKGLCTTCGCDLNESECDCSNN